MTILPNYNVVVILVSSLAPEIALPIMPSPVPVIVSRASCDLIAYRNPASFFSSLVTLHNNPLNPARAIDTACR
jgi:hypothetical protein